MSSEGHSEEEEVVFKDEGDYIETNLITEDDIKMYRLHVATEEGSKGAPLTEALPETELAKIIKKRKKYRKNNLEMEERAKSIEKLKERICPKEKTKKKKRQSRSKSPKKNKSRSRSRSKKRSKSPKSRRRKSRSRSRGRARKSRSLSRSRRRRSRSRRRRSRSRSHGRNHKHRSYRPRKVWESRSRSRSRSKSRDRDDFIKKCRSVQDGPDLKVSRPERRRRRRSSSSSPQRALAAPSERLAIEAPAGSKELVELYPSATPSLGPVTIDRVRLPHALAQQMFPVSCGQDHKTAEPPKDKLNPVKPLAITEGGSEDGEIKEEEPPKLPSLSEIMQIRIDANKLLLKNPNDKTAKASLQEAQLMMNRWQSSTKQKGKFTGEQLAVPLSKSLIESTHPLTWARKDMFLNLAPISESPGMALMKRMGWSLGEGLGKDSTGDINPLQLSVKIDKKGLMNQNEESAPRKDFAARKASIGCNWVLKIINGKHAISALGEIHQHVGKSCPEYCDLVQAGIYRMRCRTAWGEFCPEAKSINKKESKGRSAHYALTQILVIEAEKFNQAVPIEDPTSSIMSVNFQPTKSAAGQARYNAHFNNIGTLPNPAQIVLNELAKTRGMPCGVPHIPPPAQHIISPGHPRLRYPGQPQQPRLWSQVPTEPGHLPLKQRPNLQPRQLQYGTDHRNQRQMVRSMGRPLMPGSHLPPHLQRAAAHLSSLSTNSIAPPGTHPLVRHDSQHFTSVGSAPRILPVVRINSMIPPRTPLMPRGAASPRLPGQISGTPPPAKICSTQPSPRAGVPTRLMQHIRHQRTPAPDQRTPAPDQRTPGPDQRAPGPDQRAPGPDQRAPGPDQNITPVSHPPKIPCTDSVLSRWLRKSL